jgi:hypothetical protein
MVAMSGGRPSATALREVTPYLSTMCQRGITRATRLNPPYSLSLTYNLPERASIVIYRYYHCEKKR